MSEQRWLVIVSLHVQVLHVEGAIWASLQKIFFTIDDEGLYDEPIVHTVGEIARAPGPITFQYRMDNRLIGF